jgi:hypothetical protein
MYTKPNEPVLADDTVAFVVAKGFVPAPDVPGDVLLEALHVAPFPGNPASVNYDDALPDFEWPLIFGLGNVSGPSSELANRKVVFPVTCSDFIRGATQESTISYAALLLCSFVNLTFTRCVLDKPTRRWANVPIPTPGTQLNFVAMCSHVSQSGNLCAEIENLAFASANAPPPSAAVPIQGLSPGGNKRRKFRCHAPPRVVHGAATTSGATSERVPLAGSEALASSSTLVLPTPDMIRHVLPIVLHTVLLHLLAALLPPAPRRCPLSPIAMAIYTVSLPKQKLKRKEFTVILASSH